MIVTIATALLFVELKDATFLKALSEAMLSLWLRWELRALVVLSLTVQFILIKYGNRRRFSGRHIKYISVLVWLMYLFADWLATVALSTLLRSRKEEITSPLVIFWAPFLLLHLGGPDSITAYSLSDNELWPRHFFGLCFQIGVALYVYVKFWDLSKTVLRFMAIPIFIDGIIKYGERVWSLFKASSIRFRKSMLSTPSPEAFQKEAVDHLKDKPPTASSEGNMTLEEYLDQKPVKQEYRYLHRAFLLFKVFRPLFSDLKLRIHNKLNYMFKMNGVGDDAEEAFKIVETELGFLYDVLYTKIPIVTSRVGVFLRFICLSCVVSTLIAFMFVVGTHGHGYSNSKADIGISYLLMVGALFLEIYSAIQHLTSEWGILWLTKQKNGLLNALGAKFVQCSRPQKGIRTMAQHSLLGYCFEPRKIKWISAVLTLFDEEDNLEKYFHTAWKDVSLELKKLIYSHLREKREQYEKQNGDPKMEFNYQFLSDILDEKGYKVLQSKVPYDVRDISWSITDTEFTHSLLIWHIATDLVYHDDHQRFRAGALGPSCYISKLLSDYMMYLLFLCPAMLPEGIGNVRHRDTVFEAERFFQQQKSKQNVYGPTRGVLDLEIEFRSVFPETIKLGGRKATFFEACQVGTKLQSLVLDFHWDHEDKWELIAGVWLHMLTYAASQCSWKEHAKQLQLGEELLTHVALLMAHLGLTKKIQLVPLPERLKNMGFEPSLYWDKLDRLAYYLA